MLRNLSWSPTPCEWMLLPLILPHYLDPQKLHVICPQCWILYQFGMLNDTIALNSRSAHISNISPFSPVSLYNKISKDQRWEFIKRKQESGKNSTKKAIKKTRKKISRTRPRQRRSKKIKNFFFPWSLSWPSSCFLSCFLTFLVSFINSHLRYWFSLHRFKDSICLKYFQLSNGWWKR